MRPPRKHPWLGFAALCALAPFTEIRAQGSVGFTFHAYVDPVHGDDAMAMQLNPRNDLATPAPYRPLADYAASGFPDVGGPNGRGALQHAPYSFRTLTGGSSNGGGALDYIGQVFPNPGSGGLPWSVTLQGETREVHAIIIHCLPGLYGPDSAVIPALPGDFDAASGLRYNGELFPIVLPRGVSLQGTSALDTIFDARGTELGSAGTQEIVFLDLGSGDSPDYFIDSVTFRNARSDGHTYVPSWSGWNRNSTGCAIYLPPDVQSVRLTIGNCFFVDNDVGIALDTDEGGARPDIVNNTFVFNKVAIWSGYRPGPGSSPPNIGSARPVIINNVFDTRRHDDPDDAQRTPWLGLHPDDVAVRTVFDMQGVARPNSARAFNAWDSRRIGQTFALAGTIPNWFGSGVTPGVRGGGNLTAVPPPEVDLAPFLGTSIVPRGILYVADALRLSGVPGSPHDFRLAPLVVGDPRTVTALTPVAMLNPLVNRGVDLGASLTRNSRIEMQSTTVLNPVELARYPGIDVPSFTADDPDRFHAWDFDCEGFGNPRIRCRAGFPGNEPFGVIDLGADELDELVMAGYVPSTRMFAVPLYAGYERTTVYFFDLRNDPANHPRPYFTAAVGRVFNWWLHKRDSTAAQGCPDCVSYMLQGQSYASNYTDAATPAFGSGFITERQFAMPGGGSQFVRNPIMRNLECDFSPSLMPDAHSLWGVGYFGVSQYLYLNPDVYAANPWYGLCVINQPAPPLDPTKHHDNWNIYRNPAHAKVVFRGQVREGTMNPPGTFDNSNPTTFPPPIPMECGDPPLTFLPGAPTAQFGPYGSCGGTSTYRVGTWGFGDAPNASTLCADQVPLVLQWQGIRFNCQVSIPGYRSNLQTFLTVVGDDDALPLLLRNPASSRQTRTYAGPHVSPSQFLEELDPRRVTDALMRRRCP